MKFFKNTKRKVLMRIADHLLGAGKNSIVGIEALSGIRDLLSGWITKELGFCWNCQWFDMTKPNADVMERLGKCRVNPPVVNTAKFPAIKGGDWCGSFSLRKIDMRKNLPSKIPREPLLPSKETAVEGGLN